MHVAAVNLREVSELTCSYSRTNRDLYEGTDHYYPGAPLRASSSGRNRCTGQLGGPETRAPIPGSCRVADGAGAQRVGAGWAHWAPTCTPHAAPPAGAGLLTERWFPDSNPTNLRYEMRRQILELMAVSWPGWLAGGMGRPTGAAR